MVEKKAKAPKPVFIDIHGKKYETVASRVCRFRDDQPIGKIVTNLVSADEATVVFRAEIYIEDDILLASGHAEEERGSSMINKTSALENCETSAVGRALAFAKYDSNGSGIASADEVAQAIHKQNNPPAKQRPTPKPGSGAKSNAVQQIMNIMNCSIEDAVQRMVEALTILGCPTDGTASDKDVNDAMELIRQETKDG